MFYLLSTDNDNNNNQKFFMRLLASNFEQAKKEAANYILDSYFYQDRDSLPLKEILGIYGEEFFLENVSIIEVKEETTIDIQSIIKGYKQHRMEMEGNSQEKEERKLYAKLHKKYGKDGGTHKHTCGIDGDAGAVTPLDGSCKGCDDIKSHSWECDHANECPNKCSSACYCRVEGSCRV
jgi:hypothetical protein